MDATLRQGALTVARMAPADASEVRRIRLHPHVERYQGWRPATVEEVEAHALRQQQARAGFTEGVCQLVIREAGRVVGDLGVETVLPGRVVELGIALDPAAWGRGLATRACRLLLDHLFSEGLHRVRAAVDPRNAASLRLMARLGFREEGRTIESYWDEAYAEWTDEVLFGLLAREWPAR